MTDLKSAVEVVKKYHPFTTKYQTDEECVALQTLISCADAVDKAGEELPDSPPNASGTFCEGFYKCKNIASAIIARLKEELEICRDANVQQRKQLSYLLTQNKEKL